MSDDHDVTEATDQIDRTGGQDAATSDLWSGMVANPVRTRI